MIYLKRFADTTYYEEYMAGSPALPNVSYCDDEGEVFITPASPPVPPQYFTFEVVEAGTVTIKQTNSSAPTVTIQYSTDDGQNWTSLTTSTTEQSLGTFSANDKVLVKGSNSKYATNISYYNKFGGTAKVNLSGNIMSLIYGDNFNNQYTLTDDYTFTGLFAGYSKLQSAENLILPATTLTTNCYNNMFQNCTSLTTALVLPATTLTEGCYNSMFSFSNSLNYIKCLATNISATNCTNFWVSGVATKGTFIKNASMSSWSTGLSGIPSGWNVIDDGNQILATIDGVPVYLDSTRPYDAQLSYDLYSQPTYDPQQGENEWTYLIAMGDDAEAGTYYTTCTPVPYMINIYYDDVEVQADANQTLADQGYTPAYDTNIVPAGMMPTDYSSDYPIATMNYYSYYEEEPPLFFCPNCGAELDYEPDQWNPCSNCGYPLLFFCPNCGEPLDYEPDEFNPCWNCGYPNNEGGEEAGEEYCEMCGEPLTDGVCTNTDCAMCPDYVGPGEE